MCTSSWNGSPSVASEREVLVWVNLGFREHTELIIKNPRLSCNILLTPSLDPDWRLETADCLFSQNSFRPKQDPGEISERHK